MNLRKRFPINSILLVLEICLALTPSFTIISGLSIKNCICTLWKVYDNPSYTFIMDFYDKVLKGYSYSKALTNVKRELIRSDKYYYPLFWSPFILYETN